MTQADRFPEFFDRAPQLLMRDPLAQFLGATPDGVMAYRYQDAVKLAGHSCPTVAGAYLMVVKGLSALYGSDIPERGGIEVLMRDGRDEGTTGVIANVAMLLTGAAPETGFAGVGPMRLFGRRDLLAFGSGDERGEMLLRRRDTGAAVAVSYNPSIAPWPAEMQTLMPLAVSGRADDAQLKRFGEIWQERVEAVLTKLADDPRLVVVENV
ncbi:hypothetical protein OP500_09105 [Kingella sp. SNUBH-2017]|jgi:putative uncharacterized protein fwdE|uniref:Formylmethanofuran dehydrogenase subunit E domain-containing protein n=1 Tax=Kingella pumchi TaxID=2779506 RepID=A0ABS9NMC5_9NEIS|nr:MULTISPECIES: hypothetical protein [Kingella]MCG6503840.1 hypothetical protein [Kingella pumchi]MDD2183459.1 hypothetical protein [Kingella sp. SNUBH-2017]